jgi:hypothetical protein
MAAVAVDIPPLEVALLLGGEVDAAVIFVLLFLFCENEREEQKICTIASCRTV